MFTYESVAVFVDRCMTYACQNPDPKKTRIFEAQAFGCVQFVIENCHKSQPELESKLIKMWSEVWQPLFFEIY